MTVPAKKVASQSPGSTKQRIIDVAARLFAERGFENVSLRDITQAAGANIAAVNYHFGSKVGLLAQVFDHHAEPINRRRAELLDRYAERCKTDPPDIAMLLEALLAPTLQAAETSEGGEYFRMMMGQMSSSPNPDVRRILFGTFDHIAERFTGLLEEACPDLSREEFFWRLTCFYGAMMYAQADNGRISSLAGSDFDSGDMNDALRYMIPFLAAGMKQKPTS